jgi:hypothetical protein
MNIKTLIGLVLIIAGLIMILLLIFFINTAEHRTDIVPCFDKHGNEIIGVSCEEVNIDNPRIYTFALGYLFIFWGSVMIAAGGEWA